MFFTFAPLIPLIAFVSDVKVLDSRPLKAAEPLQLI